MRKIAVAFVFALLLALFIRKGVPADPGAPDVAPVLMEPEALLPGELSSSAESAPIAVESEPVLIHGSSRGCVAESCSGASLKWMVRCQNLDGSWGGDAEIFEGHVHSQTSATALCLFALLSAGYSHLSKETVSLEGSENGKSFGDTIKTGLKWLEARPPSDAFDASLTALVMSAAWGPTNSYWIGHSCETALARFDAFQRFDATRGDSLADAWSVMAAASAKRSSVEFDEAAAGRTAMRLRDSLDDAPSPEAAAAYLLFSKDREHPALPGLATSLAAAPPDWEKPGFTRWYFATLALFQIEGPGHVETPGESWNTWGAAVKDVLVSNQNRDGTWPGLSGATGTAVRTALGTMSLEVYYRYPGMPGVK